MVGAVEPVAVMVPKALPLRGASLGLVDLAHVVTGHVDALAGDCDSVLLSDLGVALRIPEDLGVRTHIERVYLLVFVRIPDEHTVGSG